MERQNEKPIDTKRVNEIIDKANYINNLSEHYQLMHATYAVQTCIKEEMQKLYKQELLRLYKDLKEGKDKNITKIKQRAQTVKSQLSRLKDEHSCNIHIKYLESVKEPTNARVTQIDDFFDIYLSSVLRENIFNTDGTYNYKTIRLIRELMAHELGHLVLHTQDLLNIKNTQGSKDIKDSSKEKEADLFKDELLKLRSERNRKMSEDENSKIMF